MIFDSPQAAYTGDRRVKPWAAEDIVFTGNTIWKVGGMVRTLHAVYIGESDTVHVDNNVFINSSHRPLYVGGDTIKSINVTTSKNTFINSTAASACVDNTTLPDIESTNLLEVDFVYEAYTNSPKTKTVNVVVGSPVYNYLEGLEVSIPESESIEASTPSENVVNLIMTAPEDTEKGTLTPSLP